MFPFFRTKSIISGSLLFLISTTTPVCADTSPKLLAHAEPAVTKTGPIGLIVMAKNDVPTGKKLTAADLEPIPVDENRIPMDTVREIDNAIGKVVARKITRGQIISEMDLVRAPGKVVPILIYISPSTSNRLKSLANSLNVSEADLATRLLKERLERKSQRSLRKEKDTN